MGNKMTKKRKATANKDDETASKSKRHNSNNQHDSNTTMEIEGSASSSSNLVVGNIAQHKTKGYFETALDNYGHFDKYNHEPSSGDEDYTSDTPKCLLELSMMQINGLLKSRIDWHIKLKDSTIVNNWKNEMISQLIQQPPCNSTVAHLRTPEQYFDYALNEARFLAERFAHSSAKPSSVESVYQTDSLPQQLHVSLLAQINKLRSTKKTDYHPGSNNQVVDLVHPSMYAYHKGVSAVWPPPTVHVAEPEVGFFSSFFHSSTTNSSEEEADNNIHIVPPFKEFVMFAGCESLSLPDTTVNDASDNQMISKLGYQWLPSEFIVAPDGQNCTINSYINSLHPAIHSQMYDDIAGLFCLCLPSLEHVLCETLLTYDTCPKNHRLTPQPQSTNPEEDDETVQINCDRCSRTLSNKWSIANSWTCQHDECAGCCYDVCNNCHVKPSSYVRPPRIVIPSDITGFETGGNGCGEEPTLEHFEIAEASKHLVSVDSLKVWLLQSKNLEGMDDDYPVLIGSSKYFLKDFYNRETKQWDDDYLADVIFEESDYGSTIQFQLKLGIPTFEPKHHPSVPVSTASDVHALLYGKSLQVITKIGSIELQPGEMYEGGSWHVEGMMDERIVATSCVYLENENVTESELYFRTGVNCPRKQVFFIVVVSCRYNRLLC
jgi:hypothetical protein